MIEILGWTPWLLVIQGTYSNGIGYDYVDTRVPVNTSKILKYLRLLVIEMK